MSNRRLTSILKLSLLSLMLAFTSSTFADPVKAAFVYIGPTGDHGWTYAHDQGANYVKDNMGDDVEITRIESVAENSDAARVITSLARKNDIIFTTSFGYMEPTIKVAARYPDVKFEHATGYKRPTDNISTYSARFYEGRHVIGKIAGRMTKSNVIGYIASFPIPEVIRGINSAFLAARSVNPDVQIKIVWVYTWFDPGKEADAANALIAQGADIIMQHTDSTAAMTVAEETEGVYAFGQASDMSAWGPTSHLTSIIDDWGPYYLRQVQGVKDGTWTSTDTFDGIRQGMVKFARMTNMPTDVKNEASKAIIDVMTGSVHPFTGPINRQDGSPWLADGETPPMFPDIITMDFYVEGIDSKYPN
ncbi:MAG: BMP family ABC transporter substrate-binding protein [Candidatus Thioglobus sp.]|mgnify:CR=1 FL=1|jgi:simple sugar transport system substrate-binding protein|nr:BMP family ABC transporter substrate-binding protein [Candidatus Thioglobus sp.]